MTAASTLPGTEVAAFAAAVRAALADLPPDELDELTDGLEADLAERLDEAPDAGAGLGDPLAYAEELRAAAGYPPRSARGHLGAALPNLRTLPQELRRRWETELARHAWLREVIEFFVALRPVWWVLRGLAIYGLFAWMLGFRLPTLWPLAVVLVVASVQLGRGWMRKRVWTRGVTRVVSAIAIIAAPFVLAGAVNTYQDALWQAEYADQWMDPSSQGLTLDGKRIDNIFAFDAQGQPVDQVQLFDQDGEPLNTVRGGDLSSPYMDGQDGSMLVPSGDVPGRAGWNVFPLAHVNDWSDYADDNALDDSEISPTRFPFDEVKPLAGHEQPAPSAAQEPLTGPEADGTNAG